MSIPPMPANACSVSKNRQMLEQRMKKWYNESTHRTGGDESVRVIKAYFQPESNGQNVQRGQPG